MTVLQFKELVKERLGIPPDDQRLIHAGKEMREGLLSDYEDLGDGSTIFLVLRLLGGTHAPFSPDRPRSLPSGVPQALEDCILYCGETTCARMPCDHAICPSCLLAHAWNAIGSSAHTEVHCPQPGCTQEWRLAIIKKYGDATTEEKRALDDKLSLNVLHKDKNVHTCPGCGYFCERRDQTTNRVRCQVCQKGDFCWQCNKPWKSSNQEECGNYECGTNQRLQLLQEAPLKSIGYLSDSHKVPSLRACPKCSALIEHRDACKHIQCTRCKADFCFVCLNIKLSNGSWPCGSHVTACAVAPRQIIA